ncbi:MAG: aminoglycoside phosphotransferase family protein [Alphaproteobacteria bacterium]|nr:aminoglycoside phosphotransferase family protein [Alphaproteobacteria bacterium]
MNKETIEIFLAREFPNYNIEFIGQGWWSLAFRVENSIFRFPKDVRMGIEIYEFEQYATDFIRDKISFQVPAIEIVKGTEYTYGKHKRIAGDTWYDSDFVKGLPSGTYNNLVKSCAKFMHELHQINIAEAQEHIPKLGQVKFLEVPFDALNKGLQGHFSADEIKTIYAKYERFKSREAKDLVLLHRDFQGSNSVMDKDGNIVGVFDWANFHIGERANEFYKFFKPGLEKFLDDLIDAYESISGIRADIERIKEIIFINTVCDVFWLNDYESLAPLKDKEMAKVIGRFKMLL